MNAQLPQKTEGLLVGTAVFDALGLPTENLTKKQIEERFNLPITQFLRCPTTHPSHQEHIASHWSDDTQLKIAVTRSLIKKQDIDLTDIAGEHVYTMDTDGVMGWGNGTRESTERLKTNGFNYKISGKKGTAGNGVVMKMDPLVMFMHHSQEHQNPQKCLEIVEAFARMTHDSAIAVITAALHQRFLNNLLSHTAENLDSPAERYSLLERAFHEAQKIEAIFEAKPEERISPRLKSLMDNFTNLNNDEVLLDISNGGTFFVPNSLTMTYGLFLANAPSYDSAYRGVIIGGDTDSNAAMVAGMVGMIKGPEGIPLQLANAIWRKDEILEIAQQFSTTLPTLQK